MRILILGAGGVGGFYGARLLAAGRDVTFLVRPGSAALLARGLELRSPFGDLTLPPPAVVLDGKVHEAYHLILLSCKSYDLESAMEAIAPAVGPATLILPLLNGLAHMDTLDRRFGRERVLGGCTNVSAVRDPQGRILHLNRLDNLQFGDRDRPDSPPVMAVAGALAHAGFHDELRPEILRAMWDKWVGISSAAGITSLLRCAIGDMVAADATPVYHRLLAECAAIAGAAGFPPAQSYLETVTAKFTEPGSLFTASMLRDIEAGNRTEGRQILGELACLAAKHGVYAPALDLAWAHLRCYEERRKRELAV